MGVYSGMCVTGDFNFPDIKWTDNLVMNRGKADGLSGNFLDTLVNFSLHQAVRNPTFFPANSEPVNILDLVIGDRPDRIDIHLIGAPLGKARQAHAVIEFVLSSNSPKYESSRYNYAKGNYSGLRSAIGLINWEVELDAPNIDEAYDRFVDIYNRLCDDYIPKSRKTARSWKPPWMTSEITMLDNKRKFLFVQNSRTNWSSASKVRIYRRTLKKLSNKIKVAVISYERRIAFNKNPKQLFSYVSRRNTVDTSIVALTTPDGRTVTDPCPMADILNSQFALVFQIEIDVGPEPTTTTSPMIEKLVVTETMIATKLAKLGPFKSIGVDGIHPRVLKECATEIATEIAPQKV